MSPEPLRHAPGPRDWSPSGGYEYDAPAARPPRNTSTLTRPAVSRSRRMAGLDLGGASVMIGIISVGVAAFYMPETPNSGTVVFSTVGLLAVLMGVQSLRAYRRGAGRHRWPAGTGIGLGLLALVSTAFGVSNSAYGTALPTLTDVTSAVVAAVVPPADTVAQPVELAPDAPVVAPEPISNPPIAVAVTPAFASADEEFMFLSQSIGTAVFLIGQQYGDVAPASVFVSDTGYSYLAPDGSIMVAVGEGVRPGYALTGDGGYTLSLTGTQHGTTAYYDSRVGQILRG